MRSQREHRCTLTLVYKYVVNDGVLSRRTYLSTQIQRRAFSSVCSESHTQRTLPSSELCWGNLAKTVQRHPIIVACNCFKIGFLGFRAQFLLLLLFINLILWLSPLILVLLTFSKQEHCATLFHQVISVEYFTFKWIEPSNIFKLWMEFLKFGREL